jgi:ribokinase
MRELMSNRKPIVVVGSINLDLVTHAQHIPILGETIQGCRFQMNPGGKGANQAVAIARLGYPVQMIGKIGDDIIGTQLWASLEGAGVDLRGVGKSEGPSGTAMIVVAPDGDNCIVVNPGANAEVSPKYVDLHRDMICQAGLVLTQLEIPIETVEHLSNLCCEQGIPLMLDPAPAQVLSGHLLRCVRWFTPNETEADFYAPGNKQNHPAIAARALLDRGPAGVILKMGSRGAYVAANGIEKQQPAISVKAVDTTAAGDALNGAFAVGIMSGRTEVESARFAVAAASLSVTRAGAQSSMPTLAEVKNMLDGLE